MFDASLWSVIIIYLRSCIYPKAPIRTFFFLFIASCNIIRESREMDSRAELYDRRFYHDQY